MAEDKKICFTIGDVAKLINENTTLVRYWSNIYGEYIHPQRNAKGNRLFSREDVEAFKRLHYYIKERGMTLEGAREAMSAGPAADRKYMIADKLKAIREMLVEIKNDIK